MVYAGATEHGGLALAGPDGVVPLSPGLAAGRVSHPRVSSTGWLAYGALVSGGGEEWLSSVAVHDPEGVLVDLIPSASVSSPPDWSADGRRLLVLRVTPDGATILSIEVETAAQDELVRGAGIRAAAWDGADGILYTTLAGELRRRSGAGDEPIARQPEAAGFARFGTDDLYVTLEHPAHWTDGRLFAVERWHQHGRPPRDRLLEADGGELRDAGFGAGTRLVRRAADGRLAVDGDEGVRLISGGEPLVPPGHHGFDWLPAAVPGWAQPQ